MAYKKKHDEFAAARIYDLSKLRYIHRTPFSMFEKKTAHKRAEKGVYYNVIGFCCLLSARSFQKSQLFVNKPLDIEVRLRAAYISYGIILCNTSSPPLFFFSFIYIYFLFIPGRLVSQ